MLLKIYNTTTKNKEEFIPIDSRNIKFYVCGPTVYDTPHIGNARSLVVYDILYRILLILYGKKAVKYVRNITDIDDKIIEKAYRTQKDIKEITDKYYKEYKNDSKYLFCLEPDVEPKASNHIKDMIEMIQNLIKNKNAYLKDNHVYFSVKTHKSYYKLSNRSKDKLIEGARIEVTSSKKDPEDFVLWKPASKKDIDSALYDSPWGKGRPGWHIECSAMIYKELGKNIDIHGGGIDLIFPHHTNEIAQTECAFNISNFVKYWVHNGFLTVDGKKMSKSLKNFITIKEIKDKYPGEVIRYFLINSHYRKPLDHNSNAINEAFINVKYLYSKFLELNEYEYNKVLENSKIYSSKEFLENKITNKFYESFYNALLDDINTKKALKILRDIASQNLKNTKSEDKILIFTLLKYLSNLLGLLNYSLLEYKKLFEVNYNNTNKNIETNITNLSDLEINKLIQERESFKKQKNWDKADKIREFLVNNNIEVKDNKNGTSSWMRKFNKKL